MKSLKKGRYYWHRDNSVKRRHPSYIYKKNDKMNRYHIVCFTSSKGKGRTKLNKNIDPKSNKDCYVRNTPRISKRKAFDGELVGYKVTDKSDKKLIKSIAEKKK